MSEEEFWTSSPDKLVRLSMIHHEVNNPKSSKERPQELPRNGRVENVVRGETVTLRKV